MNIYEIAQQFVNEIKALSEVLDAKIAGSIRRGKPDPKDIDVVVKADDLTLAVSAIAKLDNVIPEAVREQYAKVEYQEQTIDIWLSPPNQYGAILCFYTGPREFNGLMAERAYQVGLRYNRRGLWTPDFKSVVTLAEATVFAAVGVEYLEPADRIDVINRIEPTEIITRAAKFDTVNNDRRIDQRTSDGRKIRLNGEVTGCPI